MCSIGDVGVETDVASADSALTRALHEGVEHLNHDQSAALLAQLRALTAKADALSLAVVGKVDADGTHTYDGCLSTGAWVRAFAHQTPAEAARSVRTARTLRTGALPNTTAALAAGAISGLHAAAIADGVKDAPAGAVA
jgi:lactam utilization protein B